MEDYQISFAGKIQYGPNGSATVAMRIGNGEEIIEATHKIGQDPSVSQERGGESIDAAIFAIEDIVNSHLGVNLRSSEWTRDKMELGSSQGVNAVLVKLIGTSDGKSYEGRAPYSREDPWHEAYVAAINEMLKERRKTDEPEEERVA